MAEAGSVYAEAELNIDKFLAASAQLESEGSKIAGAMDQCATGVEKAQDSLEALGTNVSAVQSQMSAAAASFDQSASSLDALQAALDAARLKSDGLAAAYEQAVAKFGEGSSQAEAAASAFDSNMNVIEGLEQQMASAQEGAAALGTQLADVNNAMGADSPLPAAMEQAAASAESASASVAEFGSAAAAAESSASGLAGAASEIGSEGAQIASAMSQAAAGSEQANGALSELALSLESARATMAAAQLTFEQSEASLSAMQAAVDEARAKTEELGEAYEKVVARFGKGSLPEFEVAKAFDEALNAQEALEAQMEKQQVTVKKNEAAFKKAAAAVSKYENKLADAESTVAGLDAQMEGLNGKLQPDAMNGYGEAAVAASESAGEMSGVLGNMLTRTASSAARSLGTLTAKTLGFDTSSATGVMAARGISTGLRQIVQSAGAATLAHVALGAAVAYGAYLVEVAKQWEETNITTSFEKSEGLKAYGLSADDFGPKNNPNGDWVADTIKTWTDGAKETDEILKATVEGFTSGSKEIKSSLSDLQTTAAAAGVDDVLGLDADIQRLDEIDASVEKLLKKRQNGYLTEDEKGQLQSLYDERESIALKYHLVPDGTSGYDEIVQNAEAALRRGASESTVWADAYAAASQGQAAFIDNLNAEYDARYKVIDLMEEGAEKQAALAGLDTWYNEQNTAGIEAYRNALQSVATELTGAFEENGTYADTTAQLATAVDAMNAAAADPSPENMQAFTDALADLDETQVVEMAASLTAMQAAGVEMSAGMTTALESIEALKGAASADSFKGMEDLFTSLNSMFGENLDNEVHELNISLNTENLNTVYDAWAAGEHAPINASIEPEDIDASTITISGTVGLNGEVLTVTTKLGNSYTIEGFTVGVDGQLTGVNPKTGQTYTVEGLKVDVDGQLSVVNPKTGQTYKVTGVKAGVDGELLTVMGADGVTYTVSGVKAGVDGEVVNVTLAEGFEAPKIEVEATVTKLNFEEGKFSNSANPQLDYNTGAAGANAGDSTGKWYDFLHLTTSDVQVLNDYAQAIRNYNAAQAAGDTSGMAEASAQVDQFGNSLYGFLSVGDGFANMAMMVANGLQLMAQGDLDPTQTQELLNTITNLQTVAENIDYASMAAPISEGLAEAFSSEDLSIGWENVDMSNLGSTLESAVAAVDFTGAGQSAGEGVGQGLAATDISGDAQTFVTAAREAVGAAEGEGSPAALFMPAGQSAGEGFGQGLSTTDVSASAQTFITSVLAALTTSASTGFDTAGQTIAQGIAAGFASGLGSGAGAASASAQSLVSAVTSALDTASADATTPGTSLASNFAGGISAGAGTASANASSMASAAVSAASSGMSGASSIGRNFASGLASGISAGRSAVVSAAASIARAAAAAARSALAIHSPSKVTEEMGEYFDLGFIRGVDRIAPDIRDSIEDALYIEPPAGAASTIFSPRIEATPTVSVKGQSIDYERMGRAMAEAMQNQRTTLMMDSQKVAEIAETSIARTQAERNRRIAMGYGKI